MVSSEVNKKEKGKMGPVFVLSIGVAAVALPLLAPAAPAAAAVIDPQFIFADGFEAPPPEQRLDYAGTVGPAGGEISAHQGRVVLNFPPVP
jgi:hypothetical protein